MDTKAELKREYTIQLQNILAPFIYNNMKTIYDEACKIAKNNNELKEFQIFLHKIQLWPNTKIMSIIKVIQESLTDEIQLSDLIKAIVKANIAVYTNSNKKSMLEYNIEIDNFVKAIYIECANDFYNYPYLFYHKQPPFELKKNQREAMIMIKDSIENAIRKMLPLNFLLKEFLNSTLADTPKNENEIQINTNIIDDKTRLKQMLASENKEEKDQQTYSLSIKKDKDKDNIKISKVINDTKEINIPNIKKIPIKETKKENNQSYIEGSESYMPDLEKKNLLVESYGNKNATKINNINNINNINKIDTINATELIKDNSTNHITGSYKGIIESPASAKNNKVITNEIVI